MDDQNEVEVVYSLESVKGALLLILLGAIIGGTASAGYYAGRLNELATRYSAGAVINGNLTITPHNGQPIELHNMNVTLDQPVTITDSVTLRGY